MIKMLPLLLICLTVYIGASQAASHPAKPVQPSECRECADAYENNNTFDSAAVIGVGSHIWGRIESEEDQDWYKFTLTASGSILIDVTNLPVAEDEPDEYMLELWSSTGTFLLANPFEYDLPRLHLNYYGAPAGTYYMRIYRSSWALNIGPNCYHLMVNSQPSPDVCQDSYEPNNDMYDPPLIPVNEEVISKIWPGGDIDCFKFRTTDPYTFYVVKLRTSEQQYFVHVYDSVGGYYEVAYDYTHEFEDSVEIYSDFNKGESTYSITVEGPVSNRCYSLIVTPRYADYNRKKPVVKGTIPNAPIPVFRVYPVPTTGVVYMELRSQENKMQFVTITDMHGKILYTRTYRLTNGFNRVEIQIPTALPNGTYLVTDGERTKKVVVLR